MTSVLKLALFGAFVILFSSCQKEPECKRCSAQQQVYMNGQLQSNQQIGFMEYCDDDLAQIEANPVIETNQSIGGSSQRTVLTYTCN